MRPLIPMPCPLRHLLKFISEMLDFHLRKDHLPLASPGGWIMDGPGRPSLYKPEFAAQAFELCLAGATNRDLADTFEVGHSTIDNWLQKHPEFAQSVKRGRDLADGRVAHGLYSRHRLYLRDHPGCAPPRRTDHGAAHGAQAARRPGLHLLAAQPPSPAMARRSQAAAGRGPGLERPGRGVRAGAPRQRGRSRRTSFGGVCFSARARGCSHNWRRRRRPC
jgi:hypothetical protein